MSRTPQEKGLDYEQRHAKRWGMSLQPGSGSTPIAMLDTARGKLVSSLKLSTFASIRITAAMLREARAAATGPRARSTEMIPALSFYIEDGDEDWTALPTDILMEILAGAVEIEIKPTRLRERRAAAEPSFLRDAN